jgi:hypothetical protein
MSSQHLPWSVVEGGQNDIASCCGEVFPKVTVFPPCSAPLAGTGKGWSGGPERSHRLSCCLLEVLPQFVWLRSDLTAGTETGRCGMMKNAKWTLAFGLQHLGSECRDGRWTVSAAGRGTARCPECDVRSTRRHGWQVRHLQDLPAQGTPVTLRVNLARGRCQNRGCERQTFSDRIPHVAGSCAQRTCRVAELTRLFGHAAGGRPAERLHQPDGLSWRES